ncbi:MAG: hypothetical protein QW035_03040 [Candidatus Anstonellales archaeon]
MLVTLFQYIIYIAIFFLSFELPKQGLGAIGGLTMLYAFLELTKLGGKQEFKESDYLKDIFASFFFPVLLFLLYPKSLFPALCLAALALIRVGSLSARILLYAKPGRSKKG